MRAPQVTVLMSCYNAEQWLEEAIESVLSQSFTDFEFIIVNDGSRDKTLKIIRSYAIRDTRIVVLDKKNTGLIDSLNRGIGLARGQWIARIDADDLCEPKRLEKQIDYVSKHPKTTLLGTGFIEINVTGKPIMSHRYPTRHKRLINRLERLRAFFPHSSAFYNTALAKKLGGYRVGFLHAEDHDFWLSLSEHGELACLVDPLVRIRRHVKQISLTEDGLRQRINGYAGTVCYFIRRGGVADPSLATNKSTSDHFFAWMENKLKESNAINRRQTWAKARSSFFQNLIED